jgi:uncharacterized protein YggE
MEKSLQDSLKNALGVLTMVLLLLSVYIVVQIFTGSKTKGDFDTITVDASAETFMAPDIAEISFSVVEENKDLSVAQEAVDVKIKTTISSLKEIGIEEKISKQLTTTQTQDTNTVKPSVCNTDATMAKERLSVTRQINQYL